MLQSVSNQRHFKRSLTPNNVSVYTWTEDEGKTSSNEVASVVFNEINSLDLNGYNKIRLVADGCPGQNKNINVLTMCGKWLANNAPPAITNIELVFPITGHSFLPADRVFGLTEKRLKNMKTILQPAEYQSVFAEHGTVKVIGRDWTPYDWKLAAQKTVKSAGQLHFKLSKCQKINIRKTKKGNILFRGEYSYNLVTGNEKSINRKGASFNQVQLREIPIGVPVKKEKLNDVGKLLQTHFGNDWKDLECLQWYKDVLEK